MRLQIESSNPSAGTIEALQGVLGSRERTGENAGPPVKHHLLEGDHH